MSKVIICISDGIGGQILGFQCAYFVQQSGVNPKILVAGRDEVYNPLFYLFKDKFDIEQVDEKIVKDHHINYNETLVKQLKGDAEEFYYVCPDILFRGNYAFDYRKYNVSLGALKTQRLLLDKFKPKKAVYINLNTTTPGYLYHDIPKLIDQISKNLPNHEIHVARLTNWANISINLGNFSRNFGENVVFYDEPELTNQIELMLECELGVYTDNGFANMAYHTGQTRILLDPRFGFNENGVKWQARWRQTLEESVDINTSPDAIGYLAKTLIEIPQTQLLNRAGVCNNLNSDWTRELGFKV